MNIMSNIPNFNSHTPLFDQEKLNSIDPLENQLCRVCNEQAAGFHFGAFTCEGCKSFFGRSCNNQTVIQECRNNYQCVIDKKNRTACKACRLRKCLMVGMSKSGCRYGRRSNWFKIHCLMQKNAQKVPLSSPSPYSRPPPIPHHPISDGNHSQSFLQISPSMVPSHKAPMAPYPPNVKFCSRSPSPLNTSTETDNSIEQSISPSPTMFNRPSVHHQDQAVSPPPSILSPQMLLNDKHPSDIGTITPPSMPMLDMASLYRLSPLFAVNPALLLASQHPLLKMDFKHQLDLLAERRAMFEKFKSQIGSLAGGEEAQHDIEDEAVEQKSVITSGGQTPVPTTGETPIDLSCK